MVTQLFAAVGRAGVPPLRVGTEVKSMLALIQLLRAGPDLSCAPDALIQAQPEPGIRFVAFDRAVWSFAGGALIQRALENYLPLTTLVNLVRGRPRKYVEDPIPRNRDPGKPAHLPI